MVVTLLYCIAGGMLGVLGSARLELISWKFLRLVGLLTVMIAVAATAILWKGTRDISPASSVWWTICAGLVLVSGSMGLFLFAPLVSRRPATGRWIACVGGVAGVAASSLNVLRESGQAAFAVSVLLVVGQVCSAWLLGAITLAWLLGHAYLTATKMTIAPLRFFSRALSAAVVARIGFVAASLLIAWVAASEPSIWAALGRWWLIAVLRFGVGLGLVAVMAYMVADCVRLRSTQSATGILYFASVMAYVGELSAQYLTSELRWPF